MQLQVGDIVEGKVTGITNFGAFVKLAGGETGMVHISEVSTVFIKDIKEHLSENQEVKVKILSFGDGGKISLSIKQALSQEPKERPQSAERNQNQGSRPQQGGFKGAPRQNNENSEPANENQAFELMMAKFKQASDEKMSALKRYNESKQGGGYSRRGR